MKFENRYSGWIITAASHYANGTPLALGSYSKL